MHVHNCNVEGENFELLEIDRNCIIHFNVNVCSVDDFEVDFEIILMNIKHASAL